MKHLSILYLFTIISFDSFSQNKLDQNQEPMDNIIKVAAAQVSPVYLNKQKTVEKACKTIEEAAQNGNLDALYNLAILHDYGFGTKKNEKEAFKLYLKSAEKGYIDAQAEIGWRYRNGVGVYRGHSRKRHHA